MAMTKQLDEDIKKIEKRNKIKFFSYQFLSLRTGISVEVKQSFVGGFKKWAKQFMKNEKDK